MYIVARSEEEKKMNISSKNRSWLMEAISRKAVSVNLLEIRKIVVRVKNLNYLKLSILVKKVKDNC